MRHLRAMFLPLVAVCMSAATAAAQVVDIRGGDHMVTLTWKPYTRDTMAVYHVWRAGDSTSAGVDISGPLVRTTTFVDKTATMGALYFYSVEVKSPMAGPKPIRSAPQRFTMMKAPLALPKRP